MKESKIWGETEKLFDGNNVEIHRIKANKDGYCSKHKHNSKYNMFRVESGKLKIDIYHDNGIIDSTIIGEGESTFVLPTMYHKFIALENTIAYEIYWAALEQNDIIREDVGGILKK